MVVINHLNWVCAFKIFMCFLLLGILIKTKHRQACFAFLFLCIISADKCRLKDSNNNNCCALDVIVCWLWRSNPQECNNSPVFLICTQVVYVFEMRTYRKYCGKILEFWLTHTHTDWKFTDMANKNDWASDTITFRSAWHFAYHGCVSSNARKINDSSISK